MSKVSARPKVGDDFFLNPILPHVQTLIMISMVMMMMAAMTMMVVMTMMAVMVTMVVIISHQMRGRR